jgi:hypothetical protein
MSFGVSAGLRTGEVAARAGVNIQTLRYYKRRGPLAEPHRSIGGHRAYPADTVPLLQVARCDSLTSCTCADCPIPGPVPPGRQPYPAGAAPGRCAGMTA